MPSMREIAAEARLSVATVSRVLHNEGNVSEENRQKVMRAIQYLELSGQGSDASPSPRTIYLMADVLDNPYYYSVLPELNRMATSFGYTLVNVFYHLSAVNPYARHREFSEHLATVIQAKPAGLLSIRNDFTSREIDFFKSHNLPCIQLFRTYTKEMDSVIFNDEGSIRSAVRHLIACGHRNVMAIGNEYVQRGTRAAFEETGADSSGVCCMNHYPMTAQVIVDAIQTHHTTAIITHTENATLYALQACNTLHLRIPQDISIVAYDDFPWMRMQNISIVQQPLSDLVTTSIQLLHSYINQAARFGEKPLHVKLDGALVNRGSNSICQTPVPEKK